MKLSLFMCVVFTMTSVAGALSQQKVTMQLGETTIRAALTEFQRQTNRIVSYNDDQVETERRVTVNYTDIGELEFLARLLEGTDMTFKERGDHIVIVRSESIQQPQAITLQGRVLDTEGKPVAGASVIVKGTTSGVATDANGNFSLRYTRQGNALIVLTVSFIGYKPQEVVYREGMPVDIVLHEDAVVVQNVVVTGIFDRPRESYTGAVTTISERELKLYRGQNLSFTTIEYLAQFWTLDPLNYQNQIALKKLEFDTDYSEGIFSGIYGAMYNVIAQANDVYANIQSKGGKIKSDALRGVIEAEALAIRAFGHMEMLRLFGQVPRNATITVSLPYAEKVTKEAIPLYNYTDFTKLIMRDFDAAEELFAKYDPLTTHTYLYTDDNAGDNGESFLRYRRFRFNLYAVKALKARLHLYMGNADEAYRCAKEVVDAVDAAGETMISLSGISDLGNSYYGLPTECLLALGDFQLANKISLLTSNISGLSLDLNAFNELFEGESTGINNRAAIVWNRNATNPSGVTRPQLRKYNQPADSEGVSNNILTTRRQVIPLVRLSEMYLIMMETTGSLAEANTLYKTYMESHNVKVEADLTRAELDAEIVREYRREFFGEGQMFYYYKRNGSTAMMWRTDGEVTEANYVVPVPATETTSNPSN